jgi:hypothetical protein
MNRRQRRAQVVHPQREPRVAFYGSLYDDEADEHALKQINNVAPTANITHVYFDVCVADLDRAQRLVDAVRTRAEERWPSAEIHVAASAPEWKRQR